MCGKGCEGGLGLKSKSGLKQGQGGKTQGREICNQGHLMVPCNALSADLPPDPSFGVILRLHIDVKPANDPLLKPSEGFCKSLNQLQVHSLHPETSLLRGADRLGGVVQMHRTNGIQAQLGLAARAIPFVWPVWCLLCLIQKSTLDKKQSLPGCLSSCASKSCLCHLLWV